MHTQSAIIPLAVLFVALLSGCATILKNPRERVPIVGPDDVLVTTFDSGSVPIYLDKRNHRYVELSAAKDAGLIVTGGGRRDTVVLEASPSPGYAAVDAVALFVGLAVDGVTGAWNSFNDQGITYLNDSIAKRVGRTEGWQAVSASALSPGEGNKKFGLSAGLFVNHLNLPTLMGLVSLPSLVSGFGGQLALRVAPGFEIGAAADVTHGSTYDVASGGEYYPVAENGGLQTQTFHGFVRANLSGARAEFDGGWRLMIGGGMTRCEASYGYDTRKFLDILTGRGWLPTAAIGAGYRTGLYFIEARVMLGLSPVAMRSVSDHTLFKRDEVITNASIFMITFRSGLHIGI